MHALHVDTDAFKWVIYFQTSCNQKIQNSSLVQIENNQNDYHEVYVRISEVEFVILRAMVIKCLLIL